MRTFGFTSARPRTASVLGLALITALAVTEAYAAPPTTNVLSTAMRRVNKDGSTAPERGAGLVLSTITFDDCAADRAYKIELVTTNNLDLAYSLQAWAGTSDCTPNAARRQPANQTCWNATVPLAREATSVTVRVRDILSNDKSKGESYVDAKDESICTTIGKGTVQLQFMWVRADDQPGSPATGNPTFTIDTTGPAAPTNLRASPGETLLVASWDRPTSFADITGYRVYCDPNATDTVTSDIDAGGVTDAASSDAALDANGASDGSPDAGESDAGEVDAAADAATVSTMDAATVTPTGGGCGSSLFRAGKSPSAALKPCAETQSSIGTELTVTGLENNRRYAIAVAAVNRSGNVSALSNVFCETPIPVDTFFDQYKAAGGGAGCATSSVSPSLAALGVGAALVLSRLRKRRRS